MGGNIGLFYGRCRAVFYLRVDIIHPRVAAMRAVRVVVGSARQSLLRRGADPDERRGDSILAAVVSNRLGEAPGGGWVDNQLLSVTISYYYVFAEAGAAVVSNRLGEAPAGCRV